MSLLWAQPTSRQEACEDGCPYCEGIEADWQPAPTNCPSEALPCHLTRKEPAMKTYRCDDWSRLTGAKIEIQKSGKVVRTGTVDAVMPDNSIIWLATDHNGTRELFESAEEYEVWADDRDLADELYSAVRRPTTVIAGGDVTL